MKRNLSLLCDFYEFTMSYGYLKSGLGDKVCHFDVFFRQIPDNAGFVIAAGLEQIIDFVQNLHFDDDDIEFFRSKKLFDDEFFAYLKNFRFQGDIWAVREGEIVFANEPILSVRANAAQAQLLETFVLLSLNHQSLIATKASRIVRAAANRPILEFGSRRAQGIDAALKGTRAAFIGGVAGSACALADKIYGINSSGTMAHSWVQMFESEFEAFKRYCELYPHNAILLVDTYNAKKGVANAIKAFKQVLVPRGIEDFGIRLDSGDLCELSKFARTELDRAGLAKCKIIASGALDEFEIARLLENGAKIDIFGVGERLITAKSSPVLGCVYKLVAVEENGRLVPKIKISESLDKISNPHHKRLYRFFEDGKALYDELYLADEDDLPCVSELCEGNSSKNSAFALNSNNSKENSALNSKSSKNLSKNSVSNSKSNKNSSQNSAQNPKNSALKCKELLIPIFQKGKLVYETPSLKASQDYAKAQLACFDEGIKALQNPSHYEIRLSKKLQSLKNELLQRAKQ